MVTLQDSHVHAGRVHLGDHPLRRRIQVFQAGRVHLHDVIDTIDGQLRLAITAHAEVDFRDVVDAVRRIVEQLLLDTFAVALPPEIGEISQVILPEF